MRASIILLSVAALTAAAVSSAHARGSGSGHSGSSHSGPSHSGPSHAPSVHVHTGGHHTQPKPASSYRQPMVKNHEGRGHRHAGQGIAASRARKPLPPANSRAGAGDKPPQGVAVRVDPPPGSAPGGQGGAAGGQGVAASSTRQPLPPANTKNGGPPQENSGPPQAAQVPAGGGTPGSQAGFVWVPNNGAVPGHWERASNAGKANPVTEVRDHPPGDGNKLFVDAHGNNRAGDPVIVDRNGNKVTIVHEGNKTYLVDSNGKQINFQPREGAEPDIAKSLLLPLAVPGALIVGGVVGEPIGFLNSVLEPPSGEASTRGTVDHRGEKAVK